MIDLLTYLERKLEKAWEVVWHVLFAFLGLGNDVGARWQHLRLAGSRLMAHFALAVSGYMEDVLWLPGYLVIAYPLRTRRKGETETETLRSAISGYQRIDEVANSSYSHRHDDYCESDSQIELHCVFNQSLRVR